MESVFVLYLFLIPALIFEVIAGILLVIASIKIFKGKNFSKFAFVGCGLGIIFDLLLLIFASNVSVTNYLNDVSWQEYRYSYMTPWISILLITHVIILIITIIKRKK